MKCIELYTTQSVCNVITDKDTGRYKYLDITHFNDDDNDLYSQ